MSPAPALLAVLAAAAQAQTPDTVATDSVVRLRGVVITATRANEAARFEQPLAVTLVETQGGRSGGRITPDLLRGAAGIHVQQTSAGQGAVVLRGLTGNQVLLLVDGIPLNNGTYRDGPGQYLATVDQETVQRVEVVRGPASVLYGSDAQGGVVHLVTRPHPEDGTGGLLAMNATSATSGVRGRVAGRMASGAWSAAGGVTLASAGDLRAGGAVGRQQPTGFDAAGADARIAWRPSAGQEVVGAFQRFTMRDVPRYDRYVDFRAPAPGPDVEHVFDPQTRELAYLRHTARPAKPALARLETTLSFAIQREGRAQRRRLSGGQPDSLVERVRDDVFTPGVSVVGSSLAALLGRPVALTWGADLYRDRLASSGTITNLTSGATTPLTRPSGSGAIPSGRFPDGGTMARVGLFASLESELHPSVRLSAGARWSTFRTAANVGDDFGGAVVNRAAALTGQAGLVVQVAPRWWLATRVAQGFRAPNLYDLTNVGPVPGGVQLPNPDARPERSVTAEMGLRRFARRGAFEFTVYHMRIADFMDRAPGVFRGDTLYNGERVFQGRNVGRARVAGVEGDGEWMFGAVEVAVQVSYTHGAQRVAGSGDEPMSKVPPLGGGAELRWQPAGRRWWASYGLRWAAPQRRLGARDLTDPRIEAGGTPGFAVHGLRWGYVAGTFSVTGGLDNITDLAYRDHASGVDNPGRHVWLGVELRTARRERAR